MGMVQLPSDPLATMRLKPVSVWVTLTSAAGIAAPLGSWTTPDICDVAVCCAYAAAERIRSSEQILLYEHPSV